MAVTEGDREAIEAQLGRAPRALERVAWRCPHGGPAVIEQRPYAEDGTPFPTTWWISCRYLARAVARLESGGGVARANDALAAEPDLAADRARAEARLQRRRHALAGAAVGHDRDGGAVLDAGIGGGRPGGPVKCLHAHAAVALAAGPYALGERILAEAATEPWPDRCCPWT
jgi:hypothetical protein